MPYRVAAPPPSRSTDDVEPADVLAEDLVATSDVRLGESDTETHPEDGSAQFTMKLVMFPAALVALWLLYR